jgi:2'-5' RNA ligase
VGSKPLAALRAAQSCFVVFVPQAESLVSALRTQFDDSARLGVPAHITVLFPFMGPECIDASVLEKCAGIFSTHGRFAFQLSSVGRFPVTTYLEPDPSEPFIALTSALARAFPEFPPYRGEFMTIIPHLTVAQGDAAQAEFASSLLKSRLRSEGPVFSVCKAVTLIENSSGRWRPMHGFPLDSASDS